MRARIAVADRPITVHAEKTVLIWICLFCYSFVKTIHTATTSGDLFTMGLTAPMYMIECQKSPLFFSAT